MRTVQPSGDNLSMKVLDLQCLSGHAFEGWFASEVDFQDQLARTLVQCPLCGSSDVIKKLSAPRLSLSGAQSANDLVVQESPAPAPVEGALAAAWMAVARQLIANTTDVGDQFAQEARKMHYGEAKERAIRGQASLEETRELLEEGIEVPPFLLPAALKEPLQ